ncbi:unnamed protein product [Ascophyllum nodosum]
MTNQNITSPAHYHQNQPPDSGSVHESQQQQLWLSLHGIHRHTSVCVFKNLNASKPSEHPPQVEECLKV